MRPTKSRSWFARLAKGTARATGKPATFFLAVALILIWGVSGFLFHFSDTWQLVINTTTTIITFLMVFLIQSTQNRDAEAMQVKLDEDELDRVQAEYGKLAQEARKRLDQGKSDTNVPRLRS